MDTPIVLVLRFSSMCLMNSPLPPSPFFWLHYPEIITSCGYVHQGSGASEGFFRTTEGQADKKIARAELPGFVVG